MTVTDLLETPTSGEVDFQRLVNAFVDEFRRAALVRRRAMIAEGPQRPGKREGLVAAVVSALCREAGLEAPPWVRDIYSPEPFFAFPRVVCFATPPHAGVAAAVSRPQCLCARRLPGARVVPCAAGDDLGAPETPDTGDLRGASLAAARHRSVRCWQAQRGRWNSTWYNTARRRVKPRTRTGR